MRRILVLSVLLAAPAQADVADVVKDHIQPGYARFAVKAAGLAALDTCDIAVLRPAFQATFDAWMGVAHLHLGPAEDDGRGLAIAFWPDPKGLGAKAQRALLTGDPSELQADRFSEQSVAARGLMGMERLLFPTAPLPADPCPLIHATAHDLSRMADEIVAGWTLFSDTLLDAGQPGNTTYLTETEAKQELFTQLAAGLEFLADERLGRPMGTFDRPYPNRAEARLSGRSLRNVQLSLVALRSMAKALDPDIPVTIAAFERAETLALSLNDPVFAGAADPQGRLRIEVLQQAIRAAREAAIGELGPALGVGLGFNSADGD